MNAPVDKAKQNVEGIGGRIKRVFIHPDGGLNWKGTAIAVGTAVLGGAMFGFSAIPLIAGLAAGTGLAVAAAPSLENLMASRQSNTTAAPAGTPGAQIPPEAVGMAQNFAAPIMNQAGAQIAGQFMPGSTPAGVKPVGTTGHIK